MFESGKRWMQRRWLIAVGILVLAVLAFILVEGLNSASPVGQAKRFFRESFIAGTMTERMQPQIDRMSSEVAVRALAELLEEQSSLRMDWYDAMHARMPAAVQKRLPTPVNRLAILTRSVQMVERFPRDGMIAVPVLVRLLKTTDPKKSSLRTVVIPALGRMGPRASEAIPALLECLEPNQITGYLPSGLVDALVTIDPSGNRIDAAWQARLKRPGQSGSVSNLVESYLADLTTGPLPLGMSIQRSLPTTSLQVLGLVRVEAPRTVPIIRRYLHHEHERVRGTAATALGRLGPGAREALPEVRRLFHDEWFMVREAATNAVLAIEGRSQ